MTEGAFRECPFIRKFIHFIENHIKGPAIILMRAAFTDNYELITDNFLKGISINMGLKEHLFL